MAIIGCGPMGVGNMNGLWWDPRVRFVAACDPIRESNYHGYNAKTLLGRDPIKRMIDKKYGTTATKSVADWREVIADPDMDAVLVSTGDYWHSLISAEAMKAGKHIYCQKPLTLGVNEGKALRKIANKAGVTFQVGSQQRSETTSAEEMFFFTGTGRRRVRTNSILSMQSSTDVNARVLSRSATAARQSATSQTSQPTPGVRVRLGIRSRRSSRVLRPISIRSLTCRT